MISKMDIAVFKMLPSLLITIVFLSLLDILSTVIMPVLGISEYRLPFNILVILFLGFRVETKFIAIIILVLQYFHSFFSLEGWAIGTIAGVIVSSIMAQVKDMIHLSSPLVTIILTQIFQLVWFLIIIPLFYLQSNDLSLIFMKFSRFIPESIVISLVSPLFYTLLEKIWSFGDNSNLGDME